MDGTPKYSSLWKISDGCDQWVFSIHGPLTESANMVAKRGGRDNIDHKVAKEGKAVDGISFNDSAEDVNQFKGRVVYIGLEVSKIGGGVVWSVAFLPENMRRVR